jgi:hypothetical protein
MMQRTYSERYDGLQIEIESKMLKSGKCQVKFMTKGLLEEDYYGYVLVEEDKTLLDVVSQIKGRLRRIGSVNSYYQQNLYSMKRDRPRVEDFVIFRA